MKYLRFDSVGGASGDMILGALIAFGADKTQIHEIITSMLPGVEFKIENHLKNENGLHGTSTEVIIEKDTSGKTRHLPEIEKIIINSKMPENAAHQALKVFSKLAEVEAEIHNTDMEQVHFHEIGAVDSIIDIAGSCIAMHMLDIEYFSFPPLPVGQGSFECAHGTIPLPAPATAELLKDCKITPTDEPFELVTPTGAALLTCLGFQDKAPPGKIIKSINSFGHRKLNRRPNLLRGILIETKDNTSIQADECIVMESNIDDCSPEIIGTLFETLFKNGALDVFTTPVQMKKQRPGTLLSVICNEADITLLQEIIFRETTSFGIRFRKLQRKTLEREITSIQTPYGQIRIKTGILDGKKITFSPEMDDCIKLAEANKIPVKLIFNSALKLCHDELI